jgi:endonuclease/exonuclease/phosphatase family metal-dependent hydrolase
MTTPPGVRALHWNVHSWTDDQGEPNVEPVADLLRHTGPDVVSLVEVNEELDGPSSLSRVAAEGGGYHSVYVPILELGGGGPVRQFGNAVLSRLPILDVRHLPLLSPPPTYDGSTEETEQRTLVLVRVESRGGPLWVGCTHLPRGDAGRRTQALDRAASVLTGLPEPWLLLGDFNCPPSAWLGQHPGLRALPEATPSYPTAAPTECIDYCVVPRSANVRAEVLPVGGSDHLPLTVQLEP